MIDTDKIEAPFIFVHANNENWGMFSTYLPNRTADWGSCCSEKDYGILKKMLDHHKLLMFVVTQHANYSHPKILTLPRGVP